MARETWETYRDSIGDRSGLFTALQAEWAVSTALYPGSYLDLSPSVAIQHVTYVDLDRRAERFFADRELVEHQLHDAGVTGRSVEFIRADYAQDLPLERGSFDLLISMYAGPLWEHCARYVKSAGLLLANNSHGDASVAALDSRLELIAAVHVAGTTFRLDTEGLDQYLIPKKLEHADADRIRSRGRGMAFTKPAFAYIFRHVDAGPGR